MNFQMLSIFSFLLSFLKLYCNFLRTYKIKYNFAQLIIRKIVITIAIYEF